MQALSQKICQKYGWSARFEKEGSLNDEHVWNCFVTVGINDERQFATSPSTFKDTVEGNKKGMATAAQAAVDGLQEEVARQEAKPRRELVEVFPMPSHTNKSHHQKHTKNQNQENASSDNTKQQQQQQQQQPSAPPLFAIRGSSPPNWNKYIWSNKPKIVGIDTEGNQSSSRPPVLVQIATDDCVLLEIPAMVGTPPRLSDDLQRLLADDDIVKVFCDNFAHHDKRSLGLLPGLPKEKPQDMQENKKQKNSSCSATSNNDKGPESLDFSQGTIIDLEALSAKILGPVKVARGLSRIVALSMPELNVVIGKPPPSKKGGRFKSIGRFTMIEQGKAPPLTSLRDLSRKDQHYAAVDAWATLQAYKRLSLVTAAS